MKSAVNIPVAVKLSPFFSNMAHMARRLEQAGADGLVLFNRFLQPELDLDTLALRPTLGLSEQNELLLRLRWIRLIDLCLWQTSS